MVRPCHGRLTSKHVLNAQVAVRAPCCRRFFDCPECHAETQDHRLAKTLELAFVCKKCRRAFRKDMTRFEAADEFCPHCDNHYVIEAKTPQLMLQVEGEDGRVDPSIMRDPRVRRDERGTEADGRTIDEGGPLAAAYAFQAKLAAGGGAAHTPAGAPAARAPPPPPPPTDDDLDWT